MRGAAHDSYRKLQEKLSGSGGDVLPCAVLVGRDDTREAVRSAFCRSLGCVEQPPSQDEGADAGVEKGIRGRLLGGSLAFVEPLAAMDAVEATEAATFLRGIQQAHGLILALPSSQEQWPSRCSAGEGRADALPLVASFYRAADPPRFFAVALVGASSRDAELRALAAREATEALEGAFAGTATLPEVFCVDIASDVERLAARLRSSSPAPCEPLSAPSPLLAQYRVLRQRLDQRKPPSRPPSGGATRTALGTGAPSTGAPSTSATNACTNGASNDKTNVTCHRTVMVFGKTGAGKSHLGNLLVGRAAFASGDSVASVTNTQSVRTGTSSNGLLTVLDTIGFGDTRLPAETVIHSLRDTALEAPSGIDVVLFVLKKERVTPVEQEILAYVTQFLFGPECLPNLYIVVTHAGRLAKDDLSARSAWLVEQQEASPIFAAMVALLGADPVRRIAFVENADPCDAHDDDEKEIALRKRQKALAELQALLERHRAPPFRHSIMRQAGELHRVHLEELKRDLRSRIEEEVRREVDKDRGALLEERDRLRAEVEGQRQDLQSREEELQRRCEEEWSRMRAEFEKKARELAREDLEPLAKDIVETTEKKHSGRRCVLM
eukprot:TRINITY_DN27698_c0_g4_i1.p1 TRINITY_DN27698_c0_g4~~TRINITY_DN27698_c0_g4_i1.p1  ORF type:complete len:630 (+),score=88.29 TRINITY_DN27698_c0_g4_i1:61-1890(+)